MKKITIILLLTILLTGCASPVNNQNQNRNQNKDNNITVQEISNLMLEDWQQIIIIKNNYIIYRGKPGKIDQDLLNESVLEIANTEDNYNNNSITLIIE